MGDGRGGNRQLSVEEQGAGREDSYQLEGLKIVPPLLLLWHGLPTPVFGRGGKAGSWVAATPAVLLHPSSKILDSLRELTLHLVS